MLHKHPTSCWRKPNSTNSLCNFVVFFFFFSGVYKSPLFFSLAEHNLSASLNLCFLGYHPQLGSDKALFYSYHSLFMAYFHQHCQIIPKGGFKAYSPNSTV